MKKTTVRLIAIAFTIWNSSSGFAAEAFSNNQPATESVPVGEPTKADIKTAAIAIDFIRTVNELCRLRDQELCISTIEDRVNFQKRLFTNPGYIILSSHYSNRTLHTPMGSYDFSGIDDEVFEEIKRLPGVELRQVFPLTVAKDSHVFGPFGPWHVLGTYNGELIADEKMVKTFILDPSPNPNNDDDQPQPVPMVNLFYDSNARKDMDTFRERVYSAHAPSEEWVKQVSGKANQFIDQLYSYGQLPLNWTSAFEDFLNSEASN